MIYSPQNIKLKNGVTAVFRSPEECDAENMLRWLKTSSSETDFVVRCPEECTETPEDERAIIAGVRSSGTDLMILCEIDGEIAGACRLTMNRRIKTRHRGSIALSVIKKYWNLGIGSAMISAMTSTARDCGVTQLELEVIEGNDRAKALYEKHGFITTGRRPNVFRLKDGTMLGEYIMVKSVN